MVPKKGGQPTPEQRLALLDRRRRVAELYLRGTPQYKIAQLEDVSDTQISRDLKFVRAEWLKSAAASIAEHKAKELARIDRIEEEAWAAWERSCGDAKTIHVKQEESDEGKVEKTIKEHTTRASNGDPRFLERACWCVEQRCKILGLVKDVNLHIGDNVVNVWDTVAAEPDNVVEVKVLSVDQDQASQE